MKAFNAPPNCDLIFFLTNFSQIKFSIFSKNVIIDYLDNNVLGEYLDFSIKRSSMLMSRKIVYTNLNNILKADAIEINLDTKDTKIYMYQNNKKVNIKSK